MKKAKGTVFVEHIENHLREMEKQNEIETRGYTLRGRREVICKICDKTVEEIYEEYKKAEKS